MEKRKSYMSTTVELNYLQLMQKKKNIIVAAFQSQR